MTDREMLELAAKAAGMRVGFDPNGVERGRYDLYWSHVHHQLCWQGKTMGSEYPVPVFWDPLTDDGDALRLAVRLELFHRLNTVYQSLATIYFDAADPDPYAATRRAVVRAAAEIGRSKT